MKSILTALACLLLLAACDHTANSSTETSSPEAAADSAHWVIQQAIQKHGGDHVAHSRIAFDFRDRHYVSDRQDGQFTYERIWQDTTGEQVRDVLTNNKFYREINGQLTELSAKDSAAYANSTNSVIYFALLPYYLQDKAVHATYLGKSTVKGQEYYKVKVTFGQEGGGKDHEDQYIYWFHPEDFTMDYLAYNYLTDGGGARFREAYNVRTIEGIRFADYINYKPKSDTRDVAQFDALFDQGQLEELSRIDSENISVELK
ncbi:MAG: DUF6503 family protein [Saprospiraceae bacterium]|nr:hypothetical protein [Lewinella sp.]